MAEQREQHIAAWRTFLETHAYVLRVLEAELEEGAGLPLTWFDVLIQLASAEGKQLRMQELAERLLISRSGFTRLCDRMEAAGLIRRARCETDRRGVYAAITDKGKETFHAALPVHLRGVEEHFSKHLTQQDVRALQTALEKVKASAQLARKAG